MNTNSHVHVRPDRWEKTISGPVLMRFCCLSTSVLTSAATIGQSAKYLRFRKALKSEAPTWLYGLAALLVSLVVTASATQAQSVTASTYLNELYNWWTQGATVNDFQSINVRATFLGGSAHPSDYTGVTMAIFQGSIQGNKAEGVNAFRWALGFFGQGEGLFYNIGQSSSPEGPYIVPFSLYQEWESQRLVLDLDLRGVWSNATKSQKFYFDKIIDSELGNVRLSILHGGRCRRCG